MANVFAYQSESIFLIDALTKEEISYKQHHINTAKIAEWFSNKGYCQGDAVAVMLENSVFFATFYFACLYLGVILVPLSPSWSRTQLKSVILNSGIKAIFTNEVYFQKYSDLVLESKVPYFFPQGSKKVLGAELMVLPEHPCLDIAAQLLEKMNPENEALIIYTSGSTAEPKGIVHTLANLVENGQLFKRCMGINETHRFFNYLPMSYNAGLFNLLLIPYLARASVVISPIFSISMLLTFWETLSYFKVNALWFVPTILANLMAIDRGSQGEKYCRDQIKLSFVGTAPLRRNLKKDFETRYGLNLCESYGLTETLLISSQFPDNVLDKSSVGKVLPDIQVKIVDSKRRICKINEVGEIAVKTSHLMKGYHGSLENKDYLDEENYFLTGDIGYLTADNEVVLTDRKKDLIIRGGINISPVSIEGILYKNSNVDMCAVVGIPDEFADEEIIAIIKPTHGKTLATVKDDLSLLCQQQLPSVQQPKYFLELSDFPCTITGKIQKAKLKQWALQTLKRDFKS